MVKQLVAGLYFLILLPLNSTGKKYSYHTKDISLFIVLATLKDSLHADIKLINKSRFDIYVSKGFLYIHDTDERRYVSGVFLAPASNILELGVMQQTQNYLHLPHYFLKIPPSDSLVYSCKSELPKLTNKLTINFDYLSTESLSNKFIKNEITYLENKLYKIGTSDYVHKCTAFSLSVE